MRRSVHRQAIALCLPLIAALGLGAAAASTQPSGPGFDPTQTASRAKAKCTKKQVAVEYAVAGSKITIGGELKKPETRCVPLPKEGGVVAQAPALFGVVSDQNLLSAPARKILAAPLPKLAWKERGLLKPMAAVAELALQTPVSAAGARRGGPGASSSRSEAGPTISQEVDLGKGKSGQASGQIVTPGADEVGSGIKVKAELAIDGEKLAKKLRGKASLRQGYSESAFVDRCPDPGGIVTGTYEFAYNQGVTAEAGGQREIADVQMTMTSKVQATVLDDARIKDYGYTSELVVEITGRREIAATGKLLEHIPTRVYRGTFSTSGLDPRKDHDWEQSAAAGQGKWRGPKGEGLVTQSESAMMARLWVLNASITERGVSKKLLEAEKGWYEDGTCVKLDFEPDPLVVEPGAGAPVDVILLAKADGGDIPASMQATAISGSVSPAQANSAATLGVATFTFTAPPEFSSTPFESFSVEALSKRGRAVATATAQNPVREPREHVFDVVFEGSSHFTESEDPQDGGYSEFEQLDANWRTVWRNIVVPAGPTDGFFYRQSFASESTAGGPYVQDGAYAGSLPPSSWRCEAEFVGDYGDDPPQLAAYSSPGGYAISPWPHVTLHAPSYPMDCPGSGTVQSPRRFAMESGNAFRAKIPKLAFSHEDLKRDRIVVPVGTVGPENVGCGSFRWSPCVGEQDWSGTVTLTRVP